MILLKCKSYYLSSFEHRNLQSFLLTQSTSQDSQNGLQGFTQSTSTTPHYSLLISQHVPHLSLCSHYTAILVPGTCQYSRPQDLGTCCLKCFYTPNLISIQLPPLLSPHPGSTQSQLLSEAFSGHTLSKFNLLPISILELHTFLPCFFLSILTTLWHDMYLLIYCIVSLLLECKHYAGKYVYRNYSLCSQA